MPELVFGTVELGLPYGLPGRGALNQPAHGDALRLVRDAVARGVRWFDTAPNYGTAEEVLGEALREQGPEVAVATKVSPAPEARGDALKDVLSESLDRSLSRLRRERVDVVQWHNLDAATAVRPDVRQGMLNLRGDRSAAVGATTYGVTDALAALECGWVEVLQVEFSVLNTAVVRAIGEATRRAGVKLWARSVLLKGVLTPRWRSLPPSLAALEAPMREVQALADELGATVAQLATRFALGEPALDAVLLGLDQPEYLESALEARAAGPLPAELHERLLCCSLGECAETDPRTWEVQ